ncbi:MAG: HD domain-containing phosphohydrolase, partial [Nisaea sp.]
YMSGVGTISDVDQRLLELFIQNVSIAFENAQLHEDVASTQREIVYMLGEAVETRSQETGNHVKRVAEISRILAVAYGLEEEEVELIKLASPLHDIGKIGVPDAILNKPGKLDPEEWVVMKSHAELGHRMLAGSNRKILKAAATIALEHHEKWDGSGYPHGKKGDDIHIYGRLTALADVFDALGSDRCYKQAWPLDRIVSLLQEERGRHFDPLGVDLFMANFDEIVAVRERFADSFAEQE